MGIKMTADQVRSGITTAGFAIFKERRLPNDSGTRIVTTTGQVVDVYDRGTVVVHGEDPARLRTALGHYRIDPKAPDR
jgi:hypothetical protein